MLWEISGNGLEKSSYIYGTMHVSKKVAFRLDDVFFETLAKSDVIALESDPTTWLDYNHGYMPYDDMDNLYDFERNFYSRNFNPKFPEKEDVRSIIRFDNKAINGYLYRKYAGSDDFEEETYLDMFIYQAGKKQNKAIVGLEQIEESRFLTSKAAYNPFKKKPDDWIQKKLKKSNLYTLYEDIYRDRNIHLLDSIGAALNTNFYRDHMLFKRNENMVDVLDTLMHKKAVFSGVGAAHLAGKQGMLQMLKDRGYTITPLVSKQTNYAINTKNELENLYVKPQLKTYSTPDRFLTIKAFDSLREYTHKEQKFYLAPDMTNGAYLTITRLNTFDYLPHHEDEEKITLAAIDALLFEDIPGDIVKKETLDGKFPGFSILNKTKKGDYQKYHIYKTPLELIIIKFGGKNDFVLRYEKEIFDSITFKESSTAFKTYTSAYQKYAFRFPEYYISDNTLAVGNRMLQGKINGNYYFFKEVFYPDLTYIEEDAFEASYIHDNLYKQLNVEKTTGNFVASDYKSYVSSATIDSTSTIYLKTIIKDESYYLLGYVGATENDAKTYFNSFAFKTPKYKKFETVIDTSLHFSVLTNTKPFFGINPSFGNNAKEKKPYDEVKSFTSYTSKSNEQIYVRRLKFHDLQMYQNIDSLWKSIEKEDYNTTFVIEDKKLSKKDDMYISTYILRDTASAKRAYTKNILKSGVLFGILTQEDTIAEPSDFVKNFFETFTPKDTLLGKNIFEDKTAIFFKGIAEKDSIVLNAYTKIKFDNKHVDQIIHVLNTHEFDEDRERIKNYLIRSLGKLEHEKIYPFLESLYLKAFDKPETQATILKTLLKRNRAEDYALVIQLLEQDFPLGNTSRFFRTNKNNISLQKTLFPELLQYATIQEYKLPIYSLLSRLKDSNLIKPKIYKSYKRQVLNDARIEIKRNLSKKFNYKSAQALANYVNLLFPFREERNVKDFFDKLLTTDDAKALTSYYTLLLAANDPIPNTLQEETILHDEHLALTLKKVAKKNLLNRIPDALQTQERYARAVITEKISFNEEKDNITLLKTEKVTNEDGAITIYIYEVKKETRYSENTKLHYIAFLDTEKLNTKPYISSKTYGENLMITVEVEEEQYEDIIERVKYKNRKRVR